MESVVSANGRVTIPKAVRDHLKLMPNSRVKFFLHPDGSVVLLPVRPASTLRSAVSPPVRRRITIKKMNDAIAKGAAERLIDAKAGKQ